MEISKKNNPNQKIHQLEQNLLNALIHPEDGDHRKRYVKRFIYGEDQVSSNSPKKQKTKQGKLF